MSQTKSTVFLISILLLLTGCQGGTRALDQPLHEAPGLIPESMTAHEAATLASLEQVDVYPLYTMTYQGEYELDQSIRQTYSDGQGQVDWACALFAAYGDPSDVLYGRNFDWDFSPGLLLYTDPEDGYASVSMVDLYYLGYGADAAFGLTELPLEDLGGLLDAPFLPFDGMNEAGLAIGMAAVPDRGSSPHPEKKSIDSLMVIRVILDRASNIAEAVEIFQSYDIDWGSGPALHYLVAEASGRSALIEFSEGGLVLLENQDPWQAATNFLVSEAGADPTNHCWRYQTIMETIESKGGILKGGEAIDLLQAVSQNNTQWSVVYRISAGEVQIVMGRDFNSLHKFPFPFDR